MDNLLFKRCKRDMDDMEKLKKHCIDNDLARCDTCWYARPNAGLDPPYCIKYTEFRLTAFTDTHAYKLEEGTIPKKCKYHKDVTEEQNRIQRKNRKTKEKKKRMGHLFESKEMLKKQLEQMNVNFSWVLDHVDVIHSILCPNHIGSWQDRVMRVVSKVKEIGEKK